MKRVSAIIATDYEDGIGFENGLPWPQNGVDMAWFRFHTLNQVVVMGRRTWESFGGVPLPNRVNVVVSNDVTPLEGAEIASGNVKGILEVLLETYPDKEIIVIGGANLLEQAAPYVETFIETTFRDVYECDTSLSEDLVKVLVNDKLLSYVRHTTGEIYSIWERKND